MSTIENDNLTFIYILNPYIFTLFISSPSQEIYIITLVRSICMTMYIVNHMLWHKSCYILKPLFLSCTTEFFLEIMIPLFCCCHSFLCTYKCIPNYYYPNCLSVFPTLRWLPDIKINGILGLLYSCHCRICFHYHAGILSPSLFYCTSLFLVHPYFYLFIYYIVLIKSTASSNLLRKEI